MKRALLFASFLCACSDEPELFERYGLVSVGGEPLPLELMSAGSDQSYALIEGELTVLDDGLIRTRETFRRVTDGDTTEVTNEWTTEYELDDDRMLLIPLDPGAPGVCIVAMNYRLEDDGRRLRSIGVSDVGDCDELPIVGPEPFERIYESLD